jgi:hypothetical protein
LINYFKKIKTKVWKIILTLEIWGIFYLQYYARQKKNKTQRTMVLLGWDLAKRSQAFAGVRLRAKDCMSEPHGGSG